MAKNPFIADDSGRVPLYIAGREDQLISIDRIATVKEDIRKKNYLVTGLRGVGKSVLITKLKQELEENQWICSVITVFEGRGRRTKDLIGLIIEKLAETLDKELPQDGKATHIHDFRKIYLDSYGSIESKTQKVIEHATDIATENGKKGIMLGFDEAQFIIDNKSIDEYPRSILLSILQGVQGSGKNFFYAFAGLPNLLISLQESKPNIERAFGYYEKLSYLSNQQSKELITKTLSEADPKITFDSNLIDHIVELCSGYPYFLQYYCSKLIDDYNGDTKASYTLEDFMVIEKKLTDSLDEIFYDSRFDILSDSDKRYFHVSLELKKPFAPKDLLQEYNNQHPNDQKSQVAIRQAIFRLVQKGLLLKKPNGYDYTIPMIDAYVERRESRNIIDFL